VRFKPSFAIAAVAVILLHFIIANEGELAIISLLCALYRFSSFDFAD